MNQFEEENTVLESQLTEYLHGELLNDLPLDYIRTTFFSDIFLKHKVLGTGGFGVVISVIELSTQKEYAMKIISREKLDETSLEVCINEARLLSIINHPNVAKFNKVYESVDYIFIVMELATGGSLNSFLKYRVNQNIPVTDTECSLIIKQVLLGLSNVHKNSIIHRDINLNNILLHSFEEVGDGLLIIDFGLGTQFNECSVTTKRCGTIIYMAPEQFNGDHYTKVNIFIKDRLSIYGLLEL